MTAILLVHLQRKDLPSTYHRDVCASMLVAALLAARKWDHPRYTPMDEGVEKI